MRKFAECRLFGMRPFKIPTLRDFPPRVVRTSSLPPSPRPVSQHPVATRRASMPPPVRSRSSQRKHDCMFGPNQRAVEGLIDGQRGELHAAALSAPATALLSPLGVGLMLTFLPPVAIVLVWQSPHFSQAARIAVTAYGLLAFVALLVAGVAVLHA